MGRVGFEPTTPSMSRLTSNVLSTGNNNITFGQGFWRNYREYLQRIGTNTTVNDRYNYSTKYCKYLFDENTINEMLTFSPNKRLHIMKALSSLSKFSGRPDF